MLNTSQRFLLLTSTLAFSAGSLGACILRDQIDENLNRGIGAECFNALQCDKDLELVCAGNASCQEKGSPGTKELSDACDGPGECRVEYQCHAAGACAPPGAVPGGGYCDLVNYCVAGLVCGSDQICKTPGQSNGTSLAGKTCRGFDDCAFGMLCGPSGECEQLPFYRGRDCSLSLEDTGLLRAFFEVPEPGVGPAEFYRAPFPADYRKQANGMLDLSGHPEPGTGRQADMLNSYFSVISESSTAFSTTGAVYFRFSGQLNKDTLLGSEGTPTVHFINLDADHDDPSRMVPFYHHYRQSKGKYICGNRLAVRPEDGAPLEHGTTYGVFVTNEAEGLDGEAVERESDFDAMVAETAPAEARLRNAYASFAPLRAYLAAAGIPRDSLLTATVFTTDDPDAIMGKMRAAVAALPSPQLTSVTRCESPGQVTPCTDNGFGVQSPERKCGEGGDYVEYHVQISVPVFQAGVPPYLTSSFGGRIQTNETGEVDVQRTEDLCLGITIPTRATPTEGWPVVLYGHGTGGSFRGFVYHTGTALSAEGYDDGSQVTRFAVIGFDQVQHGPRRGGLVDLPPEALFFNFLNPWAARDNTLQGGADIFSLVRMIQDFDLGAQDPRSHGQRVSFDPANIYYFGHSQGSITGPPGVVNEPAFKGMLLSGAGGNLIQSLLNKTQPINIAAGVRLAVADDGVDAYHEALSILQHHVAPADTINYARMLFENPEAGVPPRHVMMIYGLRDHYAPEPNQKALVQAASIPLIGQELVTISGVTKIPGGAAQGNLGGTTGPITGGVVQYQPTKLSPADDSWDPELHDENNPPDAYDGHFVSFYADGAKEAWVRFFGTAVTTGVPKIQR